MGWSYPEDQAEFIEKHAAEFSIKDMTAALNKAFGTSRTVEQMKSYYKNHGLHALPRKGRKCPEKKITTPEMDQFIRDNLAGTGHQAMADLLNERYGTSFTKKQIKNYYARNKLNSGLTGHYKKGRVPENKGKTWDEYMSPGGQENSRRTQFKPGHIPHNGGAPVGTLRIRHGHQNRPGCKPYYWEKVGQPNKWRMKHRLVWEEHNGPVPEGCIVTFANGDTLDYRIENLVLETRAQHVIKNRFGIQGVDKASQETANEIADLKIAIGKAKRRQK